MSLETPRLILRGWRDSDLDPWAAMNADPRVMEFFVSTYDRERADSVAATLQERLERDGYGWWVTERKVDGAFLGVTALQDVPFDEHFTPAREIGWRFAFEAWGHGYATEAARELLRYAFEERDWPEVVAMTSVLNLRSQRVMQRLGMTYDPSDDFENPNVDAGHRLKHHVLYRIRKASWSGTASTV